LAPNNETARDTMSETRTLNGTVLEAELAEHVRQAEAQASEVTEMLTRLDPEQLNWRLEPNRWSIGEHVAHLSLTNKQYVDAIDRAVRDARAKGWTAPGPYRYGWFGNWFVRQMEPPPRMRMRTFRTLEPTPNRPGTEILREFVATQNGLIAALKTASGVDLGRAKFRSPFIRLLRLSVGQGFSAVLAHNRRHLWHARRILSAAGFPS
jgi:hypothetical protein